MDEWARRIGRIEDDPKRGSDVVPERTRNGPEMDPKWIRIESESDGLQKRLYTKHELNLEFDELTSNSHTTEMSPNGPKTFTDKAA